MSSAFAPARRSPLLSNYSLWIWLHATTAFPSVRVRGDSAHVFLAWLLTRGRPNSIHPGRRYVVLLCIPVFGLGAESLPLPKRFVDLEPGISALEEPRHQYDSEKGN
ncbi:hypothetical protein B0H11DRAFT_2062277 [Mycena galericulata]|nr:hypothetical protein B0H11DRAFT_2062277 [Mycena galericulata]